MNLKPTKAGISLLNKIKASSLQFTGTSLVFLLFLFLLSGLELLLGTINHSVESGLLHLWSLSCLEDLKFYFICFLPVYLFFVTLHFFISKVAISLLRLSIILFFAIELLLVFYFNTTLLMLGSDIFGYSHQEILQTVGASGSISFIPLIILTVFTLMLVLALKSIPGKLRMKPKFIFILPVISFGVLVSGLAGNADLEDLSSNFERNLIKNKSEYFYSTAYSYFNPDIYEKDIYSESYLGDFLNEFAFTKPMEYVDESNYPFLHKELKRDVLSPFFKTNEKAPNIVVIVVEGLGRAFTNEGAYLGNFTPYLDSLSNKSLYWPNFLSNGGRTFAVLPSLLGSQPFGETGFMEMGKNMPQQMSLLNLLKTNGYETSFYYGGNAEFDKMTFYLKHNMIDHILDEDDFTSEYKKIPVSASGFTWGYGDKELYRYYLDSDKNKSHNPRLDILLTISMHSPFIVRETEKYTRKFEERLDELGYNEEKKRSYRNYTKQYTSILFADDALKDFISSYRQRDDYGNTIFIITGDHRIPEIPMASKIDRYHVPMIIYSPLLKRIAKFESVSSHFDLAPSLVSFLKNSYNFQSPPVNGFVGRGLDTTRAFQNIHSIPVKQTKTALIDFIMGEYHLNGDDLFKIERDLKERPVKDEAKKEQLKNAFDRFKRKNSEIIQGKGIIPDSVYRTYLNH